MKRSIYHRSNKSLIFTSEAKNNRQLIETALKNGADLSHADLRFMDLRQANLDGGAFEYADFSFSHCEGINLSEARLSNALFYQSNLENACLCETVLDNAQFLDCNLNLADISGAHLNNVTFSDLSSLQLNFINSAQLKDCTYKTPSGQAARFDSPPLTIKGLTDPVSVVNDVIIWGHDLLPFSTLPHKRFAAQIKRFFASLEASAIMEAARL
tara:strand:- start:1528 stop:2166 length:639 start_codon:yes stop_codon:yes gene_type:complete